jgi:thiol-disulfide isomerase/thioredoxin
MKGNIFLLVICLVLSAGCNINKPLAGIGQGATQNTEIIAADTPGAVDYSEQSAWLLGYFTQGQLKLEPHSAWYYKGYDEYQVNPEALSSLGLIDTEGLAVKVVLGTWCPDSRREVPRFLKVLDAWKFPAALVTFIGVDNGKLSPIGAYEQLEINRVPTFIIYKNNIEAGRIIENPVTSLEQDMVNILGGMKNNK